MPTIVLDGTGKSKAALVEMAYEHCGLAGFEFERTPEEMTAGLRHMNAMLAEWLADGIDLGYDFPTYADGLLEEPSGIPDSAVSVVTSMLAQRLCPGMGAAMSPDARAALNMSYFKLQSRYATITVPTPARTPRGAGYKGRSHVPYVRSDEDSSSFPGDYDPGDLAGLID